MANFRPNLVTERLGRTAFITLDSARPRSEICDEWNSEDARQPRPQAAPKWILHAQEKRVSHRNLDLHRTRTLKKNGQIFFQLVSTLFCEVKRERLCRAL
jgi:hypothetical protein